MSPLRRGTCGGILAPHAIAEAAGREVRPAATGRIQVTAGREDSLLTAIINWIPVDVLAAYKFAMGVIPADADAFRVASSVLALIITPMWIAFATTPAGAAIGWRQVVIAPVAFVFYAAAIQGDVAKLVIPAWQPWMGSVSLAFGTLLLVILEGILRRLGVPQELHPASTHSDAARTVTGQARGTTD
jgi:hypothetical protein